MSEDEYVMTPVGRVRASEARGIQINDTGLVAGMMVSKGLRRLFFWGSLFVMFGLPFICFWIYLRLMNQTGAVNLFFVTLVVTTPWALWMFTVWLKANYYRWVAKKTITDYREDELFER